MKGSTRLPSHGTRQYLEDTTDPAGQPMSTHSHCRGMSPIKSDISGMLDQAL